MTNIGDIYYKLILMNAAYADFPVAGGFEANIVSLKKEFLLDPNWPSQQIGQQALNDLQARYQYVGSSNDPNF